MNSIVARQSEGIASLIGTLALGAVCAWVASGVATPFLEMAKPDVGSAEVAQGNEWLTTAVGNLPVVFLVIAAAGAISYSVYAGRYA